MNVRGCHMHSGKNEPNEIHDTRNMAMPRNQVFMQQVLFFFFFGGDECFTTYLKGTIWAPINM